MSLRFIVLSSLLLFFIASTLLTASLCKGGNKDGIIAASNEEVRPKKVYAVAAAAAAREKTLSGRKLVVDSRNKLDDKKANTNGMARAKQSNFRRITISGKKNVNYVAFTEDYNKPRHHPPKNN